MILTSILKSIIRVVNIAYLKRTTFLLNLAKYIYRKVEEYRSCVFFFFIIGDKKKFYMQDWVVANSNFTWCSARLGVPTLLQGFR